MKKEKQEPVLIPTSRYPKFAIPINGDIENEETRICDERAYSMIMRGYSKEDIRKALNAIAKK